MELHCFCFYNLWLPKWKADNKKPSDNQTRPNEMAEDHIAPVFLMLIFFKSVPFGQEMNVNYIAFIGLRDGQNYVFLFVLGGFRPRAQVWIGRDLVLTYTENGIGLLWGNLAVHISVGRLSWRKGSYLLVSADRSERAPKFLHLIFKSKTLIWFTRLCHFAPVWKV